MYDKPLLQPRGFDGDPITEGYKQPDIHASYVRTMNSLGFINGIYDGNKDNSLVFLSLITEKRVIIGFKYGTMQSLLYLQTKVRYCCVSFVLIPPPPSLSLSLSLLPLCLRLPGSLYLSVYLSPLTFSLMDEAPHFTQSDHNTNYR